MSEGPLQRVLVANRGEIAIRVMRTLRERGLTAIAVYSDADRQALHVAYADEAQYIGASTASESYLNVENLLEAAKAAGADAVHPGYGFLAENAAFARACVAAGLVWIGPTADTIDAMGSKTAARQRMIDAGVPVVPGTADPLTSFAEVEAAAADVGYPIAIKAQSGGGGKGFRVALNAAELRAAFDGASGEGQRYFGDPAVYLERYLHDPRHIEVQILADMHGTVVALGERDCSIQRRHQKLVEETPSPHVDEQQRAQLVRIATGAASATGYVGAGTIECLLDAAGDVFFLEMNTRIQVEHTITEAVTGIDIVAEQLRIAAGEALDYRTEDITPIGHAIECRINAEDAWGNYTPSSGVIRSWHEPAGLGVRVDAGYAARSIVPTHYDNLLAKLVTWGRNREEARLRMLRALDDFEVSGITTLIPFHRSLMADQAFIDATTCREFVAAPKQPPAQPRRIPTSANYVSGVPARARARVRRMDASTQHGGDTGSVVAPLPGTLISVAVTSGMRVERGDPLLVLEAMKMENQITAPISGRIVEIAGEAGASVAAGSVLLRIEADAS